MKKVSPLQKKLPKEKENQDEWDVNNLPIILANPKLVLTDRSKNKTINFSTISNTQFKSELKRFCWFGFSSEYPDISERNFKDKILPSFHALLSYLVGVTEFDSILNIDYYHFKMCVSSDRRVNSMFRQLQVFLVSEQTFDYSNDCWDIFNSPLNSKSFLNGFENSELRLLNFSVLRNESFKNEMKDYLFSQLSSALLKMEPLSALNGHILPFSTLLRCLSNREDIDSVFDVNNNDLQQEIQKTGKTDVSFYLQYFEKIKTFLSRSEHLSYFERDTWDLTELNLTAERINQTRLINSLSFNPAISSENKMLLKQFFKHLLLNTQLAISTISYKLHRLNNFLINLGDKKVSELTLNDRDYLFGLIRNGTQSESLLSDVNRFFIFLTREKVLPFEIGKSLIQKEDLRRKTVESKDRLIPQEAISHMFQELTNHKEEFSYLDTILHILTFTGLRISEICNLKLDCVYSPHGTTKRIKYESVKMQKNVDVPVIDSVYHKIKEQITITKSLPGSNHVFLFPSKGKSQSTKFINKPISTTHISKKFREFCVANNVKTNKGSTFQFKAHDFRHHFATFLAENNVSLDVIKEFLAHESPQMTLSYLDKKEEREKKAIQNEIEHSDVSKATAAILSTNVTLLDETENIEALYIKKNILYQTLPNGTCVLPINMNCPHPNACLSCKNFSTTIDSLDVFKKQLERTEKMITFSEEKGFIQQLHTNMELKKKLEYFIKELENGKETVKAKTES